MIPRILDMLFLSAPHLAGDGVRQRSEERRRYRFSIHAALAGGDNLVILAAMLDTSFYPRHPRGWRPLPLVAKRGFSFRFLSTPPSRVATALRCQAAEHLLSFYPRHPRGWRRVADLIGHVLHDVSIHATLAGGDETIRLGFGQLSVSIHATLAGGDDISSRLVCFNTVFLSTPPSRVATVRVKAYPLKILVSIHATLAGGDGRVVRGWGGVCVSIHATLAGGDVKFCPSDKFADEFLSTPPSRVATVSLRLGVKFKARFYPRHPRGWRHCDLPARSV